MVLVPIVVEDFTDMQGNQDVTVNPYWGAEAPYLLVYFWINYDETFYMSNPNAWKFIVEEENGNGNGNGGGQGQAVISGTYLFGIAATLGGPPSGGGELVDCDPSIESTLRCFIQLVE